LFDANYMTTLFEFGARQGRSADPFQHPVAQQSIRSQVQSDGAAR
jgi:hypothetical protein